MEAPIEAEAQKEAIQKEAIQKKAIQKEAVQKELRDSTWPPIDLVYTWVNGSDSNWQNNKKKYLRKEREQTQKSNGSIRYQDLNELKYSLRSVEKFAPFVRKIFIVTAGQIPHWLNLDHPKIEIIHHRQIFSRPQRKYLPTFNSIAIELNLHRIPGLEEHFIYLNDDVFFGRPMRAEHFLASNGKTKVFLRKKCIPERDMDQIDPLIYNHRDSVWLTHLFLNRCVRNRSKRRALEHVGYLMKKSVLLEIEKLLRRYHLFDKTCTRFRRNTNINLVPFFYPHYSLDKRYSVRATQVKCMSISQNHNRAYPKIQKEQPHLFCLNGLPNKTPALRRFWKQYFPEKSQFEK